MGISRKNKIFLHRQINFVIKSRNSKVNEDQRREGGRGKSRRSTSASNSVADTDLDHLRISENKSFYWISDLLMRALS